MRTQSDREFDWSTGRELERKDAEIERLHAECERKEYELETLNNAMRHLGHQLADLGRDNERLRAALKPFVDWMRGLTGMPTYADFSNAVNALDLQVHQTKE